MKNRKNVVLLGTTSFFNDFSSEAIFTLLPLYLPSPEAVGIVGGIMSGLGDLTKVYFGYLSDRMGKRRPLVFAGYFLSALSKLLIALVRWPFFVAFLLTDRLGKGVREGPRDAILSVADNRGWAFGVQKALDTTGAVFGGMLAYFIISSGMDFRQGMLVAAAVGFLSLLPLLWVRVPPFKRSKEGFEETLHGVSPRVTHLLPVAAVFGLVAVSPMLVIQEAYRQVGPLGILAYVAFNIIYAFSAGELGSLSDRVGRTPVIVASFLLASAAFASVFAGGLFTVLGFALYGVSIGAFNSATRALIGDLAKSHVATSLGEFQTVFGLAVFAGSILTGWLLNFWGRGAYLLLSAMALAAVPVYRSSLRLNG